MACNDASPSRPDQLLSTRASATTSSAVRDLLAQAQRPGVISLAGGLPDAALFPTGELADLAARVIRDDGERALQYGRTDGEADCRAALAQRFALRSPDEVVITTGSQQGLDLLARALIDPGDVVVTADRDYLGVLQALRSHGAAVTAIPVDGEGLDTAALEARLVAGLRPKACYVVPHFHNPTGSLMSAERRRHLHELSSTHGFVVVEDDPYRDLYVDQRPPLEVAADPEWTVRLRSTSKTLAPGFRIGALEAPPGLRQAVVIAKQSVDLHTSTLCQAVVAAAVTAPWYEGHLQMLRDTYGERRDVLVRELRARFAGTASFVRPTGGMFVWVDFGDDVDTTSWLVDALDEGVCFVPGPAFAVDAELTSFARLSFATATPDQLVEGVARLRRSAR